MLILGTILSFVAISTSTASIVGGSVITGAAITYGVKKYKENENEEYRTNMIKREKSERRHSSNYAFN